MGKESLRWICSGKILSRRQDQGLVKAMLKTPLMLPDTENHLPQALIVTLKSHG